MTVFYISRVFSNVLNVVHGLVGFFICFMVYRGNLAKNNKTRFSYFLYSDKTRVFESERAQGPVHNRTIDI